jgi:type II secretory pathway pseudopilin PulG
MAIIAVLAVLVVGAIQIARKQARGTQRLSDLRDINTAMQAYYANHKEYPDATNICGDDSCYGGDETQASWNRLGDALNLTEIPKDPVGQGNYYAYFDVSGWGSGPGQPWEGCSKVLYAANTDLNVNHKECGNNPATVDIIIKVE